MNPVSTNNTIVYDVTNISDPTVVANVTNGTCVSQSIEFGPNANFAYTAVYDFANFCTWNITDITNISVVSVFQNLTNLVQTESLYYLRKFDTDWIITASRFTNAINISDPLNPVIENFGGDAHTGGSDAIFIDDFIWTTLA